MCFIDGCNASSHYYLGFFYNNNGASHLSIALTTTELQPVSYLIQVPRTGNYYNGTVTANNSVVVSLPSGLETSSYSHQDYRIYLETSSDKVTVIGQSYTSHTTDTYLALPTIKFNTITEYTYYAMSVYSPNSYSSILIVGTEDGTRISLKFTSSFYVYAQGYRYVYSSRSYSFTINRLQTMYIYPHSSYRSYDWSGTKIVANKPVSVFSGHRCAYVPYQHGSCGYLIEQIPPTIYWGKVHYVAPLATRRSYTLKVLAAHDATRVIIYCNDTAQSHTLNEQGHTTITLDNQEYCAVHSNNEVLVAQFSGKNGEDPSMTLLSSSNNFASKLRFSTFHLTSNLAYSPNFVNIIVMAEYYQPDQIYLIRDGAKRSLSTEIWTPIRVKNVVEAYATKVTVLSGIVEVIHSNIMASMSTIVYGVGIGYIHPGGPFYRTIGK